MNTKPYHSRREPRAGDKVRFARDIDEDIDLLYEVGMTGLGRLGNKVYINKIGSIDLITGSEYYYYCLCPQTELTFQK
jgi:hypothetical protein